MSNGENESTFEAMRTEARKIDKGVQNLEQKLSNVKILGLSLAPEEMKSSALDVLSKYEDEIRDMHENLVHCLEQNHKVLNGCVEDNENVTRYIDQLKNDLDKWEKSMMLKNDGTYQPFQEPILKESDHSEGESSDNENETPKSSCANGNSQNGYSIIDYSCGEDGSFIISSRNTDVTPIGLSETPCKDSESNFSNKRDNISSTKSTRKKFAHSGDTLKTPVDPGISVASMRVLGKSNIKTKLFKTNFQQ